MITLDQLARDYTSICHRLLSKSLAIDVNPLITSRTDAGNAIASWSRNASLEYMFGGLSLADAYIEVMRRRDYTILLSDYSALQISFTHGNGGLAGHRYCYFKCPMQIDEELVSEIGLVDYLMLAPPLRNDPLGPIRFEYDPEHASKEHPAVHCHIAQESCRVAIPSPLSIGHFIKFVFRQFYPGIWSACDWLRDWHCLHFNAAVEVPDVELDEMIFFTRGHLRRVRGQ